MQWADSFNEYMQNGWPVLQECMNKSGGVWTSEMQKSMQDLVSLLMVWPFARDFCEKAVRYCDYSCRAYRMPFYINKVKELLVKMDNKDVLQAMAGKQPAKCGRPASPETIARREAEAQAAKQQTALFTDIAPSAAEIRITQDKLHLNQLAWLCSPELASRIETVQSLRLASETASERAKLLAEKGGDQKEIAVYAEQAKQAVEAYEAIYADVDYELAILHKRLKIDEPYQQKFAARFKNVDLVNVARITKPYYDKMKSPEFDLRVQTLVEQESPEYIEQQKQDAARKKEVQDILRYFKRKDKSQKLETARTKFRRLEELLGKKAAADYRPLLTKIEDDAKKSKKVKG